MRGAIGDPSCLQNPRVPPPTAGASPDMPPTERRATPQTVPHHPGSPLLPHSRPAFASRHLGPGRSTCFRVTAPSHHRLFINRDVGMVPKQLSEEQEGSIQPWHPVHGALTQHPAHPAALEGGPCSRKLRPRCSASQTGHRSLPFSLFAASAACGGSQGLHLSHTGEPSCCRDHTGSLAHHPLATAGTPGVSLFTAPCEVKH